ncbi:hypothetical protein JF540_12790 [Salipiger thiooxidans]|uniref:hypothetical protein n=1 Tax=Salipiger thiooxidans TaxID=282683 RepID=UPI001A8DE638|nr:hypothetical protein [Salipiger thiooxidans]MBN8187567.1 hypothetical protein [Salipiger thiooxidans]
MTNTTTNRMKRLIADISEHGATPSRVKKITNALRAVTAEREAAADRVKELEARIVDERQKALADAYQAAHDATTHPSAYACREAIRALSDAPAREGDMSSLGQPVTFTYTNWRGETAQRTAVPKSLWFGVTEWHPEPGWLMTAYDLEKAADRDFALADCTFTPAREVTVREAARVLLADRFNGYGNRDAMMAMWNFVHEQHGRHMLPVSHYDGVFQAALRALSQGGEG